MKFAEQLRAVLEVDQVRLLLRGWAVLLACLAVSHATAAIEPTAKTYQPPGSDFRISAPADWAVRKSGDPLVKLQLDVKVPVREGELRPTFLVIEREGHLKDDQLEAVARGSRREILKVSPDAIFTENQPTTLDGVKAMEFTYTKTTVVNGNKHPSKGLRVYALRNGNLYSLAFFTEPANYERALPQVREVIGYFKWSDSKD